MSLRHPTAAAVLVGGLMTLVGCGGGDAGRYRVSGVVTYDGKPVPKGVIYFDPDTGKNQAGLQGFAEITDGKYDTGQGGKGTTGGPVVIRVEAFDGQGSGETPAGKPL